MSVRPERHHLTTRGRARRAGRPRAPVGCDGHVAARARVRRAGRLSARARVRRAGHLRGRPSDEGGFVAGAESLIFGVLIFVIGTLIVANAWGAIDAKFAASAAAREATRAAVQSSPGQDLHTVARTAALATLEGHGRQDNPGFALTSVGASQLTRCAELGFAVQLEIPVLSMPGIDGRVGSYTVRSEHRELVDPYRAGLPVEEGGVDCGS